MSAVSRAPRRGEALMCVMLVLLTLVCAPSVGGAHAQSAVPAMAQNQVSGIGGPSGPLPDSQPLSRLSLRLKRTEAQQAGLNAFLAAVATPGGDDYHHWLTPEQFAKQYAPPAEQAEAARQWLLAQGFQAGTTSADGMRIPFAGTAAQVNRCFSTTLRTQTGPAHDVSGAGTVTRVNLPAELDQVASGIAGTALLEATDTDTVSVLAGIVETNTVAAVSLSSASGQQDGLADLLQQAAAQGITVILPGGGASLSTMSLKTQTAIPMVTGEAVARPEWQAAPGLPADGIRAVPDAAFPDAAALAEALRSFAQTHGRVGDLAPILYTLRTGHGIFTHADAGTPAGNWSAADGLGLISVPALVKALAFGNQSANVALAVSSNSLTHGQALSLNLVVTGSGSTPTGTVLATLKARSNGAVTTLGPLSLTSGSATASTSSLPGDIYDLSATYSGDGSYASATSNTQTTTVTPEPATVTVTVPSTPTPLGSSVPVTVTVSLPSGVGTPSGTVSVTPYGFNPSTPITATLYPSGTATASAVVNVPATSVGSFTFQGNCSSNATFSCSTPASAAVTVAKGLPAVALTATPTTTASAGGNQYNLSVSVAAPAGSTGLPSPTGAVNVTDNGTQIASVTLAAGSGTAQVTLSGINHALVATYAGDANYAPATSVGVPLAGALIPTTTTLTTSVFNGPFGIGIPLTATVTPTSYAASGAPTGTVTYTSSLQGVIGTATLGNGFVTLNVTSLTAGVHNISAAYKPDNSIYAASSTTSGVTVTVTAVKQPTTTTLTVSPANPLAAQAVTLTATIALAPTATGGTTATSTFTGTVSFFANKVFIGQSAVVNNAATLVTKFLGNSAVSLTASYNGDTNFYGSTSNPLLITPARSAPGLTLTVNATTPNAGSSVTLSASLVPGDSTVAAVPTGTITFYDNRNGVVNMLGIVSLGLNAAKSASIATLVQNALGGGAHSFTAVYSGDTNFLPATSAEATLNLGDFTITFAPANLTLTRGSSAAVSAAVTPLNGFSDAVLLSCVPPAGSNISCTLTPAAITGGGQAILSVQTTVGTGKLKLAGTFRNSPSMHWQGIMAGGIGCVLLCAPRRKRQIGALLLLLCMAAAVTGGCSTGIVGTTNNSDGGSSGPVSGGSSGNTTATPLGTALLTVTAASGDNTLRHVYTYQVTVQ